MLTYNRSYSLILLLTGLFFSVLSIAQDTSKKKAVVKITGTMGITYEGY